MAVEVTIKKDAFLLYKLLVDGIASSIDGGGEKGIYEGMCRGVMKIINVPNYLSFWSLSLSTCLLGDQ